MIVCHCLGLTDREVRAAADRGARSPSEIALACGAGTRCGGCRQTVASLVAAHTLRLRRSDAEVLVPRTSPALPLLPALANAS